MFKMSLNHFNNFLTHVNNIDIYNFTSWFDTPHDFELHTILGRFSTYIITDVDSIKKYNTHKMIISSLFCNFKDRYPSSSLTLTPFIRTLQSNVLKEYHLIESQRGGDLIDYHVEMNELYIFKNY